MSTPSGEYWSDMFAQRGLVIRFNQSGSPHSSSDSGLTHYSLLNLRHHLSRTVLPGFRANDYLKHLFHFSLIFWMTWEFEVIVSPFLPILKSIQIYTFYMLQWILTIFINIMLLSIIRGKGKKEPLFSWELSWNSSLP